MSNAAPAHLPCPQCGTNLPYYDGLNSAYFGCPRCQMFFEQEDNKPPKNMRKFTQKPAQAVALPVGTLGTLRGQPYRVTGYMIRKEAKSRASWEEYMLFNPDTRTYAQLAVYEGHWTFITATTEQFAITNTGGNSRAVITPDHEYALYNRYSPRVLYAEGEFDWNVLVDEGLKIAEFIDPPLMLVEEKKVREATWYQAEHLEPAEVQQGFQVPPEQMPMRTGVGAVQPVPGGSWEALKNFSLSLALLIIATHILLIFLYPQTTLLEKSFVTPSATPAAAIAPEGGLSPTPEAVLVSDPFIVDAPTALEFEVQANLNNQWVEVPVTMVNEQTGRTYDFTKTLEYYSGVEGGESWSEGSAAGDAVLADIPAGRYHLNLYPTTEAGQIVTGRVAVAAHTPLHSNTVLLLLLVLIYPAVQYFRNQTHEQNRWNNSDYGS